MGFQYRTFKTCMRFWPVASSDTNLTRNNLTPSTTQQQTISQPNLTRNILTKSTILKLGPRPVVFQFFSCVELSTVRESCFV